GDALVRVNGRATRRVANAVAALRAVPMHGTVTLEVLRDGLPVTLRFVAEPYARLDARLADLPQPTARMLEIRAGILTGRTRP
ncbi:MAG: hypothetical protein ACREMV_04290, partial [Gemmatimonadales bacterium]